MNSPNATRGVIVTVAIVCAAVAWPLASVWTRGILPWLGGPSQTILPMLATGALAGFIVGVATASRSRSAIRVSGDAPTKAGFLTAFVAASILVLRATILTARPGQVAYLGQTTLLAAVVTILPATLFAMFMGGLGRAVRLAFDGEPVDGEPSFKFRTIHALYAGCVFALLSPFIPGLFSEPPPPKPVIAATPTPTPASKLVITPSPKPTPPPKIYEKPEGFESSDATGLAVILKRTIPDVDLLKPAAFSPNGSKLVIHQDIGSARGLVVHDLDTFTEIARVTLDASASALAWSPDSARLAGIFEQGGARRSIAVLDLATKRFTLLPEMDNDPLPAGKISWPDVNEIVVHPANGTPLALNLLTLELRPLSEAPFFTALDEDSKAGIRTPPAGSFPKTQSWRIQLRRTVESAAAWPAQDGWRIESGGPHFLASDLNRAVNSRIMDMPALTPPGVSVSTFYFSADATKALVIHDRTATVCYLGTREPPSAVRTVDMRRKPEDFADAEVIKKALAENRLGAFVCAPFTNPLTGRAIGPDSNRVRAAVRFLSWKDTKAEVWLAETYSQIEPGDLLSMLHVVQMQGVTVAGKDLPGAGKRRAWWAPFGEGGAVPAAQVPARKDVPPLEFFPSSDANAVQKSAHSTAPDGASPATFQPRQVKPANPTVVSFINAHHQKSSDGNIASLLNDYADRVDSFQAGLVDHAFLRAEEEKYHAPGHTVLEKVAGEIHETLIAPDRIRAEYPLQVVLIKPDTSWTKGVSDVTLELQVTPNGLRIVKQNSVSREREKYRGKGAPPSL